MYQPTRIIILSLGLFLILVMPGCTFRTSSTDPAKVEISMIRQDVGDDGQTAMTEAELQSQLMDFADRFASNILQGYEDFERLAPGNLQRRVILRDAVFSVSSAYTIASEADPDAALLDMLVLVTLGQQIYAEHWLPKLGAPIAPLELGFRRGKEDIWRLSGQLLNADQQEELQAIIREWREQHLDKLAFTYVRFSDFAVSRRSSRGRSATAQGFFQSVDKATQQVEEIRLIAERNMYLATRLPLLTGFFMDMTLSQVFTNPQIEKILADLHNFSQATDQLVEDVGQWPTELVEMRQKFIKQTFQGLAAERREAIQQFMDRLAKERRDSIDDFLNEEARVKGLLSELRATLVAGNDLVTATNLLAENLNLGEGEPGEPVDINDYKATLREATETIVQLNQLVGEANRLIHSPGWEKLFPKLDQAVDRVGQEGSEIIDHTFLRGLFLVVFWMIGYLLVRLILHRILKNKS